MNAKKRHLIFERWSAANPSPTTELIFNSHFELLIAVMLSAQATDKSVNKATQKLYPVANTPQAIFDLNEDGLRDYIKSIGLFNSKAKNIIKTCNILLTQHNGIVPSTREALEALPGVGRKTANVVLNTAFGQPTMAVDTHIFRVSNRMKLAPGKTPLAVEKALVKYIPKAYLLNAHHWLILHGRYTCTARNPNCQACIVKDLCEWKEKNKRLDGS